MSDFSEPNRSRDQSDDFAASLVKPRILVIEDNSDMREFLRRVLERHNYGFLEARDGAEGFEIALREEPELILLDLSLPNVDGYEVLRQLKASTGLRGTPVLAVTAHARAADEQRALEAGFDAYLTKPYSIRDLLDLVQRFLSVQNQPVP